MSTRPSNRPHQKYSMDKSIRRSKRCATCSSIIGSSPSSTKFSRPYDIVFLMSDVHRPGKSDFSKDRKDFAHLYKIKIYPESRLEDEIQVPKIRPLWKGLIPHASTFAALHSDLYCVGGEKVRGSIFVPYVYMLNTFRPSGWLPLPFMKCARIRPKSLALDGNVYILSGHYDSAPTNRGEVEVYDPMDGRWDVLPDPPIPLGYRFFCAALENPNRILVAPRTVPGKSMLIVYDVGHARWELLDEREVHNMCPLGMGGTALAVENTLYWITDDHRLLAYLLDHDMWLEGNLLCFGLSIFGYRDWGHTTLLHLEDQKICMVQSAPGNLVHCVVLEVLHNLMQKRLDISVVSVQIFKTGDDCPISPINDCFLLGK